MQNAQVYATLSGDVTFALGDFGITMSPDSAEETAKFLVEAAARGRKIQELLPKMPEGLSGPEQIKWLEKRITK
jgi:hypothetical protein